MKDHLINKVNVTAVALAFIASITLASSATAAPVTKQNGQKPAFDAFTSICRVAGYESYGECTGPGTDVFAGVTGKVNAVQAKPGIYNLGISFKGIVPGDSYTLWGNIAGGLNGFFVIGTANADAAGNISFSWQYTPQPGDKIGFDLNHNTTWATVTTSYWSNQKLAVKSDGTLGL